MQDFGRKAPGKGPVEDVDADSNVTVKQIGKEWNEEA